MSRGVDCVLNFQCALCCSGGCDTDISGMVFGSKNWEIFPGILFDIIFIFIYILL